MGNGRGLVEKFSHSLAESEKTVSASAMLTGKFLRIRKVFAKSSLLAEEYPDILEHVRILYKISRYYTKCRDELESFLMI